MKQLILLLGMLLLIGCESEEVSSGMKKTASSAQAKNGLLVTEGGCIVSSNQTCETLATQADSFAEVYRKTVQQASAKNKYYQKFFHLFEKNSPWFVEFMNYHVKGADVYWAYIYIGNRMCADMYEGHLWDYEKQPLCLKYNQQETLMVHGKIYAKFGQKLLKINFSNNEESAAGSSMTISLDWIDISQVTPKYQAYYTAALKQTPVRLSSLGFFFMRIRGCIRKSFPMNSIRKHYRSKCVKCYLLKP